MNGTNIRLCCAWPVRSVENSHTVFFRECFIDECRSCGRRGSPAGVSANAARWQHARITRARCRGRDVQLAGGGRWHLRRAVAGAAVAGGAAATARVISASRFTTPFSSPCAQVVELERTPAGALRVKRVFVALDCGTAINPDGIRAQLEGGVLMGLSAALYEEVTFESGALRQRNFDTYNVMRMSTAGGGGGGAGHRGEDIGNTGCPDRWRRRSRRTARGPGARQCGVCGDRARARAAGLWAAHGLHAGARACRRGHFEGGSR